MKYVFENQQVSIIRSTAQFHFLSTGQKISKSRFAREAVEVKPVQETKRPKLSGLLRSMLKRAGV